jgi:hypothetical protein
MKNVNVSEESGEVFVKLPGTNNFVPLGPEVQIPLGSTIDTRTGKVLLSAATGGAGAGRALPAGLVWASGGGGPVQSATFSAGIFRVSQQQRTQLITRLDLTGGKFSQCGSRPPRTAVRKLIGEGEGEFQTKGKYGTATPSTDATTKWSTVDQCNGTLMKVGKGGVTVRDSVHGKTVHLNAGQRYLIRRPR